MAITLTNKQKAYGAVLLVAAGWFVWDRASSGPEHADAAVAAGDLLVRGTAGPHAGEPGKSPTGDGPKGTYAERLRLVVEGERLEVGNVANAFALPPKWVPPKVAAAPAPAAKPVEDLAEQFQAHHKLGAVMVRARGGYAIVDGKCLFIGQHYDQFKLVSVTKDSALFIRNDAQVELRLRPGQEKDGGANIVVGPLGTGEAAGTTEPGGP